MVWHSDSSLPEWKDCLRIFTLVWVYTQYLKILVNYILSKEIVFNTFIKISIYHHDCDQDLLQRYFCLLWSSLLDTFSYNIQHNDISQYFLFQQTLDWRHFSCELIFLICRIWICYEYCRLKCEKCNTNVSFSESQWLCSAVLDFNCFPWNFSTTGHFDVLENLHL